MLQPRPRLQYVTEEEFLSLPETMDQVELLDGEVILAPSPTFTHQQVHANLLFALKRWATSTDLPAFVGYAPFDISFGRDRILQPDLFVLFERLPRDTQLPLRRIPELCIEVLSSNRAYDRMTKRMVYAEAGVQEYWVIDPYGPAAEKWTGPGLMLHEAFADRLESPLLPGFSLPLSALDT